MVTAVPFEPAYQAFYDGHHKFRHPGEIVSPALIVLPKVAVPGCSDEVVVLVTVDRTGRPEKLAVLSATNPDFIDPALRALRRARWTPGPRPVTFYYDARF